MERAFSALASPLRLPSPQGWAGMMGAFGAPRFAAALLANRPDDVVDQFARISADAGAHLVLQEILNVFCQNDCHGGKLSPKRFICKSPYWFK